MLHLTGIMISSRANVSSTGYSVGLRLVPLPIVVGHGMDIVRGRVIIHDIEFLIGLQCKHVRFVLAAFLLDHGRLLRRFKCAISQTISNINDNVCQAVIGTNHHILSGGGRGMCFGTVGIG